MGLVELVEDDEDALSCHPEQASEASASKDFDASTEEEAGSDESSEASADDSDDAAAATGAGVDVGSSSSIASSESAEVDEDTLPRDAEQASEDVSSCDPEQAGEDASSCDPEQADEDASSCDPEQADEDASSCDPEQADEDASSCHPEQASEASASKDLDVAAQADASASEDDEDAVTTATVEYVNMYRLYNPNSGEHFYTSSLDEMASVVESGWRYEGVGWVAPKTSAVPVYRLYNPNAGDHHYTTSLEERNMLVSAGWSYEGIGWYSDGSGSGVAVLRQYNPNATTGTHNFTTSSDENENLVSAGWSYEGVAWYASNVATQSIQGRWIVTSAWGSLERYWLDSTATIAKSRLVDPTAPRDSGAGYYAYAKSDGAVVRGAWDNGAARVYVADNDGVLAQNKTGWLVTGLYTNGELQRYYIDEATHAARTSFFVVDGVQYYGLGGVGYVLRGSLGTDGKVIADNDGKILLSDGWLVTDSLGAGLQRYWVKDGVFAVSRLITPDEGAGYYAYATAAAYVVRGKHAASATAVYLADNDGRLEDPGWLVTDEYDDALQRYYIDATTHACTVGEFVVDSIGYLGLESVGYVLRGTATVNGTSYSADNDGELIASFSTSAAAQGGAEGAIVSTFVGETPYLFLPAHASLSAVVLGFEPHDGASSLLISLDGGASYAEHAGGDSYDLSSLAASDGVRTVLFRSLGSAKVRTLAVMVSANVRAMYLVSDDPVSKGRVWVESSSDHTNKATGTMLLVDPDGTVVYNGDLTQIKGRGNSTWTDSDKKPYQIKLKKKTDLLETGDSDEKNKTWVLLANQFDPTLLHSQIAYDFAKEMGLSYSPYCAPIDLYYDGEYRGSYLLCEKTETGTGRVDVDSLGGGWLIELDNAYWSSEDPVSVFDTSIGHFVIKDDVTTAQRDEICATVQNALNKLANGDGSGFDLSSAACMALINELFGNCDYLSYSSTYFYVVNGIVYAGPVWDFDGSFGIQSNQSTPTGYFSYNFAPYRYNSEFISYTKSYIGTAYNLVNNILLGSSSAQGTYLHSIDYYVNQVSASQKMNAVLWGLGSSAEWLVNKYGTYAENIVFMKSFLQERSAWMLSDIAGW